jgi:cleavage stimulation factor subunit 3
MRSVLLTFAAAEMAETLKDPATAHSLFTNLIDCLSAEASSLQAVLEKEVAAAMGPEVPKPETGVPESDTNANANGNGNGMDVDEDAFAPQSEYTRQVAERERRGEAVKDRRGKEVQDVKEAMGVVWVMYMRFARRSEGIKSARAVFGRARKSVWVSWHPFEASGMSIMFQSRS